MDPERHFATANYRTRVELVGRGADTKSLPELFGWYWAQQT